MKKRITYVLPQDAEPDPAKIKVSSDEVDLTGYHNGAIEKRLTIGLSELPPEVRLSAAFLDVFLL